MTNPANPSSRMEVYLNEQRADLQVLQMTVQILSMQLLRNAEPSAAATTVDEIETMMLRAMSSKRS